MNIIPSVLERYFEKAKYPVHISFPIDSKGFVGISITAGKVEDYGSLTVFLTFNDLNEILLINNILGDNGRLVQERDQKTNNYDEKERNMNDLIYGTLQKYIHQMLGAALNRTFYEEIIPLPKHKSAFWPRLTPA